MKIQRRFLLHSPWTALVVLEGGERHFEVIELARDEVIVRAVLTRRTYRIAIAVLQDPARWMRGWRQLPSTVA